MPTALNHSFIDTEPLTPGTCEYCGVDCDPANTTCSLSCEAQLHRLEAAQGRKIVRVLKRWRRHSGKKGTPAEGAWSEITAMTSGFLKNDRLRRERMNRERRAEAEAEKES